MIYDVDVENDSGEIIHLEVVAADEYDAEFQVQKILEEQKEPKTVL
jgi:hypothetical protein